MYTAEILLHLRLDSSEGGSLGIVCLGTVFGGVVACLGNACKLNSYNAWGKVRTHRAANYAARPPCTVC